MQCSVEISRQTALRDAQRDCATYDADDADITELDRIADLFYLVQTRLGEAGGHPALDWPRELAVLASIILAEDAQLRLEAAFRDQAKA